MPSTPIPDSFHDLLLSRALAHLATVDSEGKPQVNPVWFIWDGSNVLIGVREATRKYRNLRANPHLALSNADPDKPGRYLELRGSVVEFTQYHDHTFVDQLAQKYMGSNFPGEPTGESRYRLTMKITSWTTQ